MATLDLFSTPTLCSQYMNTILSRVMNDGVCFDAFFYKYVFLLLSYPFSSTTIDIGLMSDVVIIIIIINSKSTLSCFCRSPPYLDGTYYMLITSAPIDGLAFSFFLV